MAPTLLVRRQNPQRGLYPGLPPTVRLLPLLPHLESHLQDVTQRVEREVETILSSASFL